MMTDDSPEADATDSSTQPEEVTTDDESADTTAVADLHRSLTTAATTVTAADSHVAVLYELAEAGLTSETPPGCRREAVAELEALNDQIDSAMATLTATRTTIDQLRSAIDRPSPADSSSDPATTPQDSERDLTASDDIVRNTDTQDADRQ